eukprot:TRINITY_DN1805_c0_g1_i1.p1 TRINITY_DN1805_c0_g1~~TRINITY_DN1805_c0_g1_i1.p1  ORF type:complete len:772 (-),score=122.44 TRINITY_DN1805_c0_g1_i1:14-2329(-)
MDPLLNVDGYRQRDPEADQEELYVVSEDLATGEYSSKDVEIYSYAGEDLEPAYEKSDFTSVDGWVVESGRIALPREITVRLEKMKWNAKFQDLWENLLKIMRDSELKIAAVTEAMVMIHNLYTEFVRTARFYAELLVKEKFSEKKTVKVINVGGIAGGDKYIADGIFFKFSTDSIGIYQGELNAAKAAGLELRNLDSMMSMHHPGVSFPLLAVFDFYGYRVTCMSLLPVSGSKTQKYGSATAGQTVLMEDDELVRKIENLAESMNLQKHIGGCVRSTSRPITLAVDCEGHRGTDGRIYVLDTARVMPPEPPTAKGTVFYRLFRSEFVRVFAKPLCSDSFSSFCTHEPREKEFQANIKEALNYYINTHIPKVVHMLENKESPSHLFEEFNDIEQLHMITDSVKRGRDKIEDNVNLKTFLHHHGICMRHLGIVFASCKTDYWKERVAIEMILRICKNTAKVLFRRSFERFRTPNNEAFVKFFIDYLNLLAGDSESTLEYWGNEIIESIKLSYFYHAGAVFDVDFFKQLREKINIQDFIAAFAKMTGVTFPDLPGINFVTAQPFQLQDLGTIRSTAKELSVLSISELFFIAQQILQASDIGAKGVQKNLNRFLDMTLDLPEVPSNPFYDIMLAILGHEVHQKLWILYNDRNFFDNEVNNWSFDVTSNYGFFYSQYVYQRLLHVITNERAIKSLTQVEHQHFLSFLLTLANADDDLMKSIGQVILGMYYKATDQQLKYETTKEELKDTTHDLAHMMQAWTYNSRVLYFRHLHKQL